MERERFQEFFSSLNTYNESVNRKIIPSKEQINTFLKRCEEIESEGYEYKDFEIKTYSTLPKYDSRVFTDILGRDFCVIRFEKEGANRFCVIDSDADIITLSPSRLNYYSEEVIRKKANYERCVKIKDLAEKVGIKPIELNTLIKGISIKDIDKFEEEIKKLAPKFYRDDKEFIVQNKDYINRVEELSNIKFIHKDRSNEQNIKLLNKCLKYAALEQFKSGKYVPTIAAAKYYNITNEVVSDIVSRQDVKDMDKFLKRWDTKKNELIDYSESLNDVIARKMFYADENIEPKHITNDLRNIITLARKTHPEIAKNKPFLDAITKFIITPDISTDAKNGVSIKDFKAAIIQKDFITKFNNDKSLKEVIDLLKPFKESYKDVMNRIRNEKKNLKEKEQKEIKANEKKAKKQIEEINSSLDPKDYLTFTSEEINIIQEAMKKNGDSYMTELSLNHEALAKKVAMMQNQKEGLLNKEATTNEIEEIK